MTGHQINGSDVPNSKERTVGRGPGLQFGGQTIWFGLNSYLETDVHNRPSGMKVTFRISKVLPTAEAKRQASVRRTTPYSNGIQPNFQLQVIPTSKTFDTVLNYHRCSNGLPFGNTRNM